MLTVSDVTSILSAIEQGDPHAAEQLLPLIYNELRKLAAHKMAQEAPGQTLQATALVHEAYLRLVASPGGKSASPGRKSGEKPHWDSRGHFFAAAAEAMRRILIDKARRRRSRPKGPMPNDSRSKASRPPFRRPTTKSWQSMMRSSAYKNSTHARRNSSSCVISPA